MLEPPPPSPAESFDVLLVATRALTSRVHSFTWERADGQPFRHEAGQWISLTLPVSDEKGQPLRRAYSIASAPDASSRFELAITRVDDGPGSSFLHDAQLGTRLAAKGPQGTFTRPVSAPALFVATGSGVAPFRSMVHAAVRAGWRDPLWVLLGVRTLDDALYADELRALADAHPFVRFELCLSRPGLDWPGRTGYVQQHVAELWSQLAAQAPPPHAWLCGLGRMLTQVREVLRGTLGVERKWVHSESYD
jgi:CDP-4-dehydro-6-deoxyglucose reductase